MNLMHFLRAAFVSLVMLTGVFAVTAIQTPSAQANDMTLQQAMSALSGAKADGLVGETETGYLDVVNNADNARAQQIVKLINDARRSEYARIASQNNIAVAEVEALAGQRAIERTPPGQYVKVNDRWLRKP